MKKEQIKPNILWIMTDQHKADALSCVWKGRKASPYWNLEKVLTPNLDGLAEDGFRFSNAYCPSPVCGPSRACMKTGKYPAANGVTSNWTPFKGKQEFLPQLLKAAGYETGMAGKLHFYPPDADYGFEVCHLSDAPYSVYSDDDKHSEYVKWLRRNYYDAKGVDPVALFDADELSYDSDIKRFMMGSCFRSAKEHETGWTTEATLDFLKNRDKKRPFFFYTSYFGPHQPYGAPKPYADFCAPDEIILPDSYWQDYQTGNPVYEETCREIQKHLKAGLSEADCRELIAAYLGQVHMIDEAIGDILHYLKESGLYESTMIIFSSDHGDHLGEHGLFFKGQMYDSCVKVPLIIKPAQNGKKGIKTEVVNTIDLFQTLLDAANIVRQPASEEDADEIESRSLLPLLCEEEEMAACKAAVWENVTYSVFGGKRDHAVCMVRVGNWKLVRLAHGEKDAVYELYNILEDPEENRNRYSDMSCEAVRKKLQIMLDQWFLKQYRNYGK